MKTIWCSLVLALMGASFSWAQHAQDEQQAGAAAAKFIKAYLKANKEPLGYMGVIGWVKKSPLVTASFKSALEKLYTDALREDPEMGYGADAVLSSQDPPEHYDIVRTKVRADKAVVLMAGAENNPHELEVRLVKLDGRWLVNGSGDVNP